MPQKSAECRHGMHRWVLGTGSYGPHIGMAHIVITHIVMAHIASVGNPKQAGLFFWAGRAFRPLRGPSSGPGRGPFFCWVCFSQPSSQPTKRCLFMETFE